MQQAGVISEHVDANVFTLVGEVGIDFWSEDQWKSVLDKHDVFVAVPQALMNMLSQGHLKVQN
jgi:hypothetical protein